MKAGILNLHRIFWGSFAACVLFWSAVSMGAPEEKTDTSAPAMLHFGGCGGVYFLLEPGEFWVEVKKYDLNKTNRKTFLRAILAGPDRAVIQEAYIPDDGQDKGSGQGPVQQTRLGAMVSRKGIYVLNITVTEDRYGEDIVWGFRTNAQHYLVETSRGHRDAPHEEPLVLLSPDAPGDVCFLPERGAFSIDLSDLSSNTPPPTLHAADGKEIATLAPDAQGTAHCTIPGDIPRGVAPWRLHFPVFKATVQIDGVTRWAEESDFPNLSLWTSEVNSWFPFHENRWLLKPYHRTVYGEAKSKGSVEFELYNNAFTSRTFTVALEFPDQPWSAELASREINIPSKKTATVSVPYTVPDTGDAWTCHVRVTPQDTPEVSTCSTLVLRKGEAPADQPLSIPLVLKPYQHENELFGYSPDYPLTNQPYFSVNGRPFISSETGLYRRDTNSWIATSEATLPDGQSVSFRTRSSKVAFDKKNSVYALGEAGKSPALLYSTDEGATYRAYPLPSKGSYDIEQFSGHNTPEGPPPLVRCTLTEKDRKLIWRRLNDLELILPEKDEEGVVHAGEPVLISKKCIGISQHSGIASSVVSREGKVHVAWAEATDPEQKVEGVPTFVVTYNRDSKTLGAPALVGYGPPANDVHNTPSITMDSKGYLHVIIGTHGRTFRYARSLAPNDAGGGWTAAEDTGPGLRQTYVGLVCDQADTLHLVFRLWFDDRAYFPAGNYATLAHMSKRPGENWSEARPLVAPPFSEYSVFYHRLTIDRAGRLFLSYDYWSTFWFYRTDHHGSRRALMMSPDAGQTWQLVNNGFSWQR